MKQSIITDMIEIKETILELTSQIIELRKQQEKILFTVENLRFVSQYYPQCKTCKGLFDQ